MPLRRLLLLPHLAWWGVRAPRGARDRWDLYWAGVGSTGDGGDVLWDSGDPAEPDRYLELLGRSADPALPVIDLGCGNGRFTRALCRAGWRGIGVDVSDAAIALAREEADRVPEEPEFLVADLAEPDAVDRIRAELGPANVFVRGVLHVLTAEARGRVAVNIGRLLGDRGVAVIAETNHRGSLLSYVENLGAGPRGLPHPLARAIASGLPTPRPFGGDELDRTFPADEWERVHVDDTAVIHAVPMHRRSEEPERIRGLVAVVRPRPRIPEPRRGGEATGSRLLRTALDLLEHVFDDGCMTAGVWYLDPNGSWQPRAERTPMPPPGEPGERLARVLPLRPPDPGPDAGWAVPGVEPETCDSGEERLSRSSRAALAEIADAVTAHRLAGARVYRAILALEGSDAVAESGYRDLPRLLSDHVRLDPAETRRLARHAEALHPTVTPAGVTLEPDLPATSTVVDHGEAGDGHVEVIRKTMTRLRGVEDLPAEVLATTEEQLAQLARTHCPAALTRAAVVIADRLDPDGAAPAEDLAPENELTYTRRKNGHLHAKTILRDPVAAELFDQAIRGATLPPQSAAVVDPDTGQPPTGADGARGEDPQIEARESKPSRQAAALMDLIEAGHAAGLDEPGDPDEPDGQREFGGPDHDDVHPGEDPGGDTGSGVDDDPCAGPGTDAGPDGPAARPPRPALARARDVPSLQLTVTVDFDTLRDQLADRSKALALLEDTTWIRPETVRRLACDAEIIPMVMGSKGEVLDVGRKTRNPPAGLRRAVRRRDRHCAFPGCRRRARHTQVHHIAHWGHGGETELDNLVCLCGYHHTLVHHSGWEIVMDQRMPWFIPPKWLDPTRTPRHNRPWTIEAA